MSPILGIFASQGRVASNSYESIATVTVGAGGSSSISFSSIPSTYKHLQIRFLSRDNRSGNNENNILLSFNSDTTYTNYGWHYLQGFGTTAEAGFLQNASYPLSIGFSASADTAANIFGVAVVDFLDYQNTNKYKTVRTLTGYDRNGGGGIRLGSGLWQSTSAISSISLTAQSGATFQQYSQFALYGIRG